MLSSRQMFEKRRARNRNSLRRNANGQPRLSVHRSSRHIYAQIIDDVEGRTVAAASSLEASVGGPGKPASNCEAAQSVGRLIGERAKEKGIEEVVFDRGSFRYHGRIAALADAAREQGLKF